MMISVLNSKFGFFCVRIIFLACTLMLAKQNVIANNSELIVENEIISLKDNANLGNIFNKDFNVHSNLFYWPYSASWNVASQTIACGACITLQATGSGSHDPPMTMTYTGAGTPAPNLNATPFVPDASFVVCPLVTTTYTVTVDDASAFSPPVSSSITITVAPCGCSITGLTTVASACNPATNTYDVSGIFLLTHLLHQEP